MVIVAAVFAANPVYEASAQEYVFTTFAGPEGGRAFDGAGSAARFFRPHGVAVDSDGSVYVADSGNHTIRKVSPAGVVTTLAGTAGSAGAADGTGSGARFDSPGGVSVDADGNVYVADTNNHTIRKITPQGHVTTLAGAHRSQGSANGVGSGARFHSPAGIAVDADGNVFVADANHAIRMISPTGQVTTFAGLPGSSGSADGVGTDARFNQPAGIAVDGDGSVYVADSGNHTIRRITSDGLVSTVAGLAGASGSVDDTVDAARFSGPKGVAVDANGNVFVSDYSNHTIRMMTSTGVVTTFAGSAGKTGGVDATGPAARFDSPAAVAVDVWGNVYVADNNHSIRKISPSADVATLAGLTDRRGSVDAAGHLARFDGPVSLATDAEGNVYVAEFFNCTIRKISPSGAVTTLAGLAGKYGLRNGTGSEARFALPTGITVDPSGSIYVADYDSHTVRKVTPAGVVTTFAGNTGFAGSSDGTGSEAKFYYPCGIDVDDAGNVYVADQDNHTIRKITPAGVVTTLAGRAGLAGTADGTGSDARFWFPCGVAVDQSGTVYVGDTGSFTIRRISPSGEVTTLAGSPRQYGSANGTGSAARFNSPYGLVVDDAGNIFVADSGNNLIRKVTPDGVVSTIGGRVEPNQLPTFSGGEDGVGSEARFDRPTDVALDGSGTLFVVDGGGCNIRSGRTPLAGTITIDDPPEFVGATHQFGFSGAGSSYSWRLTRVPSSSGSTLSSDTVSSPTLTPDVQDEYQVQLAVTDGVNNYVGRVSLSAPHILGMPLAAVEENASWYVEISLSEVHATEVAANWETMDGTAIAGVDYVAASGILTFAPGETSKLVAIQILEDSLNEIDEVFYVNLTDVSVVQNGGSAVVTIRNDDPLPTISIDDVVVTEGDSGTTDAVFTITLSEPSGRVVNYLVDSDYYSTATYDDFHGIHESGRLEPGETTATVTVKVIGDKKEEADETFSVTLEVGESDGAIVGKGKGTCTIVNDDFISGIVPSGFTANATSPASVSLSWTEIEDARYYKVFRSEDGSSFTLVGSPTLSMFTDSTVDAGKAYLYKVRATDGATESLDSIPDLATTVLFTDPELISGVTTAKAAHVTELRTAVNAVRQLAGLAAATFTDSTLMTIRRVHVVELRTALDAARTALGLPAIAYTDPTITAGVTRVKAAHVQELRDGVR